MNMLHKVACAKHFPFRGHAIDNIQEFVFSSQAQLWGNGKRESVQDVDSVSRNSAVTPPDLASELHRAARAQLSPASACSHLP